MGVKVFDRTVRRRLVNAGLRARIAGKKPFLNVVQRQKDWHGQKNITHHEAFCQCDDMGVHMQTRTH